jgi:internalin A
MTKLVQLFLVSNQVSDLAPLSSLTALQRLYLTSNPIADVSPLSSLTALTDLQIQNAQIVDVTPFHGLTNLSLLVLNNNLIVDIGALVANSGLDAGDTVYLAGNPLSATSIDTYIPLLETRGVTVHR